MALEGGEGSASCPRCSLPLGKTWYPLYRRLGGPQDRSGQVRKISPPLGFEPWTIQSIASRSTDYATQPTHIGITLAFSQLDQLRCLSYQYPDCSRCLELVQLTFHLYNIQQNKLPHNKQPASDYTFHNEQMISE